MTTKLKKPIALLLAVAMLMMLNFPSGIFGNIGFGLTANAEENTETNTETSTGTSTITFTALDGTQGESGENYDKLIDGNKTSGKWCVTSFSSHSSGVYIVFKASDRIYVNGYTITTGNDNSANNGRNPKDWTLKGCNDYDEVKKTSESWETIATVEGDTKLEDKDYTDYDFSVDNATTAYQYFKLEITAIATPSVNCMQMSEFTLSYSTCDHVWGENITRTIAPTCTEGGYDVYKCEICGAEKKVPNDNPAIGHNRGEDGKCTNCGAYMISNADELEAFAAAINDGKTSANAVLTADITVNSNLLSSLEYDDDGNVTNEDSLTDWTPIGYYNSASDYSYYTGTFDGEGHTISGLYFNDADTGYVGLFGYVGEGGAVLNVGVVDSYFQGYEDVGGVCGYSEGTITNCHSTGVVSGSYNIGGVCGKNEDGTITNCHSTGVVSGSYSIGGVCGENYGTITNCYNTVSVSGSDNVGGVCGENYGTITNCYNTGSVSGSENVGGVCGYNYVTIENCYNTGSVSGSENVGGVCGYNYSTITNCYYLSNIAVSEAKTAAQFKSGEVAYLLSQGCDIWGQKIGTDDYPVLKGDKVYATTGCVTYNNSGDTSEKDHHYKYGICTGCGGYEEPENKDGVYQISKAADLYWLADTVNSGNNSVNAVLTADITVNSDLLGSLEYDADGSVINDDGFTYWTPIGSYESLYTGTFDGQGHTISGLYVNDKISSGVGLFGAVGSVRDENYNVISAGKVLNVGVVDSYFKGFEYIGGVFGYNDGTINGCYAICAVGGKDYVGGVCGLNYGTITNCYSDNSVPGGKVAIDCDDGDSDNVSSKSTAQFASGAVAYLLNGSTSEGSLVWGQTLGGESPDAYPKAHTDTNTVYATTGCVTYNNEGNTDEKAHHYENGICTDCGKYTEPEKDESGVYQISKVTDLYWLADTVNSGNNSVNAVLVNDITVNENVLEADGTLADDVSGFTSWTLIGYNNSSSDYSEYTGTFDGQGHTISGLYFNDTNSSDVGLFGDVGEGGSVSNVGIVDSYFSGKNYVGGVCGYSEGTIENCYNSGTVSGKNYVGGVCGRNDGTITNCYNEGTVSGKNYVGGVCGYLYWGKIINCYNTGTVSGKKYVGGVCGYFYWGTITNCYNTGTVSGGEYVGGVCGYTSGGTITNCYNEGTVSGSGNVGGVCGYNSRNGTITNCYNEGTASGSGNSVGGVCGQNDGTITNCYSTGAVDGGEYVGGVCGYNSSSKITNCYNEGTVSGSRNVGGVCGQNGGTITNCCNEGTVSGSGNVGGVCGYNSAGTITNCYNEGTVSGSSNVGGVCGLNYSTIENCYNTGSVSGGEVVGGVCGNNNGSGTITNCYSTGAVDGDRWVGGVCGYNSSSSTITNCYYLKTDTINKDTNAIGNEDGETVGKAESKSTTDFTDGTVCGLVKYHSHQNGICILCDGYEPAIKTTDKYDINNDGTKDTVYEISSAGQLYWFADKVNNENETYGNANAVLTANIRVNSNLLGSLQYDDTDGSVTNGNDFTDWKPIGRYDDDRRKEYFYTGIFDGQGHTISGLYFNDRNSYNVGLFGAVGSVTDENYNVISAGKVLNVGVVDSYFQGDCYVGGVCGENEGGTINGCYAICAVDGESYVGGVCGTNEGGTITNCYNTGTVSGSSCVGGVCGDNGGTIENCYNTGTVSGGEVVGGVCGKNNTEGTIASCYNTGAVSGGDNSSYVGGVCGVNSGGTITNCYYLEGTASSGIGNATSDTEGRAESKTTEKFAGGEVAYILQSAQTADTEGDPIPQVWGQTLTGKIKDASPVLASGSAKKVYKVTFATQSNPTYAVKYANPSGVYELPTAPETDNSNYGFYKWSISQTDYSNAANDFTATTAVTGDITVYAVSSEKYGENDNEKTITTTYGTGATQDLSEYAVFATGATSAGKFTYTIESGNDVLGATIDNDTLTIPSTAPAGTYTLTIKATEKEPVISLMSDELGTEPFMFDVTITVNPLAENTPAISVNYTDETLTGFESGNYTIDGTDVTPTNGVLAVESYMGQTISIVKKASDNNHADSTSQTLEIPSRPTAPTESDFTVTQPILVGETGGIAGITSAMEYSTNGGTTWTDGGSTVTNIPGGTTYQVRYKATASSFKSDSYVIVIGEGTAEEITPIGKYSGSVKIRKEVAGDKAVFTITPVSGNADEVSSVTLYLAEYGDNGQLSSAKLGENQIVDGKLTITSDLPETNNYKFILWDIDQCPLIDAIANIY